MELNKKQYYVTLFTIAFVILTAIFYIWKPNDNSTVIGKCSITGINYVDVSPNVCWNNKINSEFCPLPTNIECSGEMKSLSDVISNTKNYIIKLQNEKKH